MEKREIKRYIFIAILAIAVCVISQNFYVLSNFVSVVLGALTSLVIGFFIAYIFNIIMNRFEKIYFPKSNSKFVKRTRRPFCIAATFTIAIAVIALIMYIVIPEIGKAFGVLYAEIPPSFANAKDFITGKLKEYPEIQEQISSLEFDWANIVEKASKVLTSGLAGILSSAMGIIGGLTSAVANLVLGIICASNTVCVLYEFIFT